MGQLTFPIVGSELVVGVRVNRNAAALSAVQASGLPAPASIATLAEIDTGSNVTAVSAAILTALGIPPEAHNNQTTGIGGQFAVRLFRVSLSIVHPADPQAPWSTHPDLLVMELPAGFPVDVLIGMDVLLGCRMLVNGPARRLTIDF